MKFKIMAILMVGLLLLNGCGKASEIPAKTALSTPKSTMKTLTIYSIDSDTMSLIPVVVKKEEKTLSAISCGTILPRHRVEKSLCRRLLPLVVFVRNR